jgi:hypothetical protein
MRCAAGRALFAALEEIRSDVVIFSGPTQVRTGRPLEQLLRIREMIREHDATCWQCRQQTNDSQQGMH